MNTTATIRVEIDHLLTYQRGQTMFSALLECVNDDDGTGPVRVRYGTTPGEAVDKLLDGFWDP